MFKRKRLLSKLACGLLCVILAIPGEALISFAEELPEQLQESAVEVVQEETVEEDPAEEVVQEDPAEEETTEKVVKEETTKDPAGEETAGEDPAEEETVEEDPAEETSEEVTEDTAEENEEHKEDADEEDVINPANLPEIAGDYYRQYASTLYADQKLSFIKASEDPEEETTNTVKISVDDETNKLVVSGTKDELVAGEFSIAKTFDFNGKCVGRFCFDASAAKGQRITLGFYLDGSEEPFATKELVKQKKKNSWSYQKDFSVDTLGLDLTGEHTLKIKVLDCSDNKPSFCLNWFEFVESSVPVIYFNINEADGTIGEMNSSSDHSVECYGSMSVKVPAGYTSADTGKVLTGGDYNLEYIRGRGNSTWDTPKKPYKLKLEESSKLLGMGKNKHWVLLANYYDNSLLRNRITYWLGKQLGMDYTPSLEPVDLVMNGEYYGSYFLCEQIRVDKNRVNIKDLEKIPDETDEANITGGYLLSMFLYGDEETKKAIRTKNGVEYLIESPEFEGYENEAQVNYIKNYLQTVEDALYSSDFKTRDGVRYSDLMDLRSTALYYWIQEFSMNGDGYVSGSTYLYKPEHDKLYWGPLWDFDFVAWGSTEYEEMFTSGWTQNGSNSYSSNWNGRLFEDKEFCKEVYSSWALLKPLLQELTASGGQLDRYADDMEITARYNFEKLGPSPLNEDNAVDLTYDEEITRLKTWIDQRLLWIDHNIRDIEPVETTITFKDEKGNVLETRTGMVGRPIGRLPEAPAKRGFTFIGWNYTYTITLETLLDNYDCRTEDELRIELSGDGMTEEEIDDFINSYKGGVECTDMADTYTLILKEMVLTPSYMDNNLITHAEKIYLNKKVYTGIYYEGGDSSVLATPQYQVTPFYADDGDVTFSTDNENVVRFNEFNDPEIIGPGECTLTATTTGGLTATAKIKIFSEEEAEQMDDIYDSPIWHVQNSVKIKKGHYYQLKFNLDNEYGIYGDDPVLISTDESVFVIGSAGVIHAIHPGTAYVICNSNNEVSICKVTVPKALGSVGTTVVRKGVKYKVTYNTSKKRTVTCMGPSKKTIKKAVIPATITINNKKYKVTKIQGAAFKNCKKLASVSIGKYVEIIGKSAFQGCKKLKKIRINASQPKIYKSTFKNVPKKAKYSVPKKAKKYFKLVLKGKKIVTHK